MGVNICISFSYDEILKHYQRYTSYAKLKINIKTHAHGYACERERERIIHAI